jgi:hypothetical protein
MEENSRGNKKGNRIRFNLISFFTVEPIFKECHEVHYQ